MTVYATDFSEYTTGAQPSDWTARWRTTDTTWAVRENANNWGSKVLEVTASGGSGEYTALTWDEIGTPDDTEILFAARSGVNAFGLYGMVRGSGSLLSENAYVVWLNLSGDGLEIARISDGSYRRVDSRWFEFDWDTWYWCRFRVEGSRLKARVWAHGDDEPGTWLVEVEDTTHTSGFVGMLSEDWSSASHETGTFTAYTGEDMGFPTNASYVLEIDWDGDGDFEDQYDTVTGDVTEVQTVTGRDYASQLTGTASPGQLTAQLNNFHGRYSTFNAESPLFEEALPGRKVRLRYADTNVNDPELVAKDTFDREGDLDDSDTEEGGLTWHEWTEERIANPIETVDGVVSYTSSTSTAERGLATVDMPDEFYAQVEVQLIDNVESEGTNFVGLAVNVNTDLDGGEPAINPALRWELVARDDGQVALYHYLQGGTEETILGVSAHNRIRLGMHVRGPRADVYVDGVKLMERLLIGNVTTPNAGVTINRESGHAAPEIASFVAYDTVMATTPGVLWSGFLEDVIPESGVGGDNRAQLRAIGPLANYTRSIIPRSAIDGENTGMLIGSILSMAGQVPPGPVAEGDVFTGGYFSDEDSALSQIRNLESVELGFVHETQEGNIGFQSRSHRDDTDSLVTFADDGSGLGYTHISQADHIREIFNRVTARTSPYSEGTEATLYEAGEYELAPGESVQLVAEGGKVLRWTGHTRQVTKQSTLAPDVADSSVQTFDDQYELSVAMPATVDSGDMLIVIVTMPRNIDDASPPTGWEPVAIHDYAYLYARVADGTEGGTNVTFVRGTSASLRTNAVARVYRITDYSSLFGVNDYGVDGLTASFVSPRGRSDVDDELQLRAGPAHHRFHRLHLYGSAGWYWDDSSGNSPSVPSTIAVDEWPGGTEGRDITLGSGAADAHGLLISTHRKWAAGEGENIRFLPWGRVELNEPVGGQLTGVYELSLWGGLESPVARSSNQPSGRDPVFTIRFDSALGGPGQLHDTIAVTGVPVVESDPETVQVNDVASQAKFGVREWVAPADLFADTLEARQYCDLVLHGRHDRSGYADPSPVISITFVANKSTDHMLQALVRRVSDRVRVIARTNSKLGIDSDFFVESIARRISDGGMLHVVTWELSPVETLLVYDEFDRDDQSGLGTSTSGHVWTDTTGWEIAGLVAQPTTTSPDAPYLDAGSGNMRIEIQLEDLS